MAHDDTLMKASKRYHDNKAGATVSAFFFILSLFSYFLIIHSSSPMKARIREG
jgi:hypothetical protein